jgi:hypothetical protein
MRLLVKYGADPLVVHRAKYLSEGLQERNEATTALMAATGMGTGNAWVQPAQHEREALTLEAVKLAVELGVDINAANLEGRTAVDGAKAVRFESVVRFLLDSAARKEAQPTR